MADTGTPDHEPDEPARTADAAEGAPSAAPSDAGWSSPVSASRAALYAALLGLLVFYLLPLHSGIMTAFVERASGLPYAPPPPSDATLSNWGEAFDQMRSGMTNSFLFVIPATVLSALLGSLAAFGLTKLSWRGQLGVLVLLVAGVFIPYQSVLVPLREFWSIVALEGHLKLFASNLEFLPLVPGFLFSLGNHADLIELSVTHTAYGIPICAVLFRGYYMTIDDEILEAAQVDGASTFTVYRRIILPLSKPMFAVTMIYQFTNIWNDLLFALVLVEDSSQHVATQKLNATLGSFATDFSLVMAAAFLVAAPTIIIYVLFGEQFAEGITGESA